MAEKNTTARYRNFACVIYPDSVDPEWQDIIVQEHVSVFVSPLHDQDCNPTGELKKPHRHVMVMYEGKKSESQVKEFFSKFGGVGYEVVNSLRGYSRYLCHLDNPEKAQYNQDDVICFNGADYSAAIGLPTDKYKAVNEMCEWINENDIFAFSDLFDYARINRGDWFRVLCDNCAIVMKEYLKSRSWKAERSENM